ncbi:hypothetical protein [Nafulsella turpanensis]|uniref:hypothetical protein n=1 Tax=Nafulsella turpanensis TaxID=1265690 RepID=UPI0003481E7E|nr:hypothetical protein [Nafulsella turpanensis]
MKKQDQFIDWLRDKVLNNPQEPPMEAWQQIAETLDVEDAWENIGEELDVESVWEKVDQRLYRYENLQFFERISYGLSALAAIPLLLFSLWAQEPEIAHLQNQHSFLEESPVGSAEEAAGEPIVDQEPNVTAQPATRKTAEKSNSYPIQTKKRSAASEAEIFVKEPSASGKKAIIDGGKVAEPEQEASSIASDKANLMQKELQDVKIAAEVPMAARKDQDLSVPEKVTAAINLVEEVGQEVPTDKAVLPKMTVGMGAAAKISWFMNDKTREALERESLTTAVPAVYTDLFLLYGFRINDQMMLQADVYLYDWGGQQYKEYRNGTYGKVENKLLYRSLGITALQQGRRVGYGRHPLFAYYQAGIYGGLLQEAKEYAFTGTVDRTEEFSRVHFGVQFGYGYNWYVLENLAVSYGVRARLDVLNAYSGTSAIPASFRRTRNASLDFNLSLKYLIGK